MKSRIISKLFLNFSRKKPKEKSKKRIETSEHHVARIHRFFEQREDDGQIRQCGRLRIHVPVRPDLSSAYGRSGAQVHVTHPPPHPPLSHRCPSNPLLASRFSLHGEAKREQRDRVLKHRRIVSIGEEKDRIGQPCKPANRGIRTGNFVPRPPKRAFGRESRATDFRFHPPRGAIPRVVHPVHQKIWPSGELAWFVVEFRAPSIFQRFSRSSCSVYYRWFVIMGVGFRGRMDSPLVVAIFELKGGRWVLFRNEYFLTVFGRVCFHGFMKYWKILVSARIK